MTVDKKRYTCGRRRLAASALAVLLCIGAAHAAEPTADCSLKDGVAHNVVRVLDGETLVLDGGIEVRLIGALAPRVEDAAAQAGDVVDDAAGGGWPAAQHAKAALEGLVLGRSIELGFGERRSDRYGRLLAHAFTRAQAGADAVWVQGWMLERGLARAYSLDGQSSCIAELIAHERIAREAATGLWSQAAYAVRGAEDVDGLLALRGTFQVVEGKVHAVADARGTTFLNFGEDFRQDFTILIKSKARRAMTVAGLEPKNLADHRVRVRGWIERRGGPLIEIHHPREIEVLADVAEPVEAPTSPSPRRSRSRRSRMAPEP